MENNIDQLSPVQRKIVLLCIDAFISVVALVLALSLTENATIDPQQKWAVFLPLIIIRATAFYALGLYNYLWRYASTQAFISIFAGVTVSSLAFATFTILLTLPVSLKALFVEWALCLLGIGGFRISSRLLREYLIKSKLETPASQNRKNLLIIGAGDGGEAIARKIKKSGKKDYNLIGFIDDNPQKLNQQIHRLPVLGNTHCLAKVVKEHAINEAIIAIPSAPGQQIRALIDQCEASGITYKITPGIFEIVDGQVSLNQIREVKIEDLLGRTVVEADITEIRDVKNKVVLVTGAGGSIGSELCRQLVKLGPKKLLLLDHSEFSAYEIDKEIQLLGKRNGVQISTIVGDVSNKDRMKKVFEKHAINAIYHAAAYKHVPLMEDNIEEVLTNNIIGTGNMIELAKNYAIERFVLISTDKAVNPANAMGASKRVCEMLLQLNAQNTSTTFSAVRFGNVLGSKGSVVPLFREQIKKGGPITITHAKMERYFMTIPEAVRLVIQAGSLAKGGEIFILDMGEPVKIINLAKDMIRLSGLEEGKDIEIIETGLRPGEKLSEELVFNKEQLEKTSNQKIFLTKAVDYDKAYTIKQIEHLLMLGQSGDEAKIRETLLNLVNQEQPNTVSA